MEVGRLAGAGGSLLLLALLASPSRAGICHYGTGNEVVKAYDPRPAPAYLSPVPESRYGGQVTRISGDPDVPCGPGCEWRAIARHHYSKDQPWSADGDVLAVLNKLGRPARIYLDGSTYAVLDYKDHTNPELHYTDWRWHPVLPYVQIVMDAEADRLYWIDVRYPADPPIRDWYFGDILDVGERDAIGQYEGNVSADGNLLAVSKAATRTVFILDMSSGARGVPVQVPTPDLKHHSGTIGWTCISPDGRYLVVKYAAATANHPAVDQQIRVFDVNPATLEITAAGGVAVPHAYPDEGATIPCGLSEGGKGVPLSPADGWVHPLKHADMMLDGGTPILVGVNGCTAIPGYADKVGRVLRVDLTSGKVTTLSSKDRPDCDPALSDCYDHEAPAIHVSCRNFARPGWAYVTYEYAGGEPNTKRFSGEIVAVPVDGSGMVQRFALTHTNTLDSTVAGDSLRSCKPDCEAQAVPDPSGARIVWASNWNRDCGPGCGRWSGSQSYVLDARCIVDAAPEDAPPRHFALHRNQPNPFHTRTSIRFQLPVGSMVRIDILDAQGRRLQTLANGFFPAGQQTLEWNARESRGDVAPGVYFCQIRAGLFRDRKRLVLLP